MNFHTRDVIKRGQGSYQGPLSRETKAMKAVDIGTNKIRGPRIQGVMPGKKCSEGNEDPSVMSITTVWNC